MGQSRAEQDAPGTAPPGAAATHVLAPAHRRLHIGGTWRASDDAAVFPVEDPATGQAIAEVANATPDDALAALTAADEAQPGWARTPARERSELLLALHAGLQQRREDIAALISAEMGKSLREARGEVDYGAEFFRFYAEEAVRVGGTYQPAPKGGFRILTVPRPVGPCVLVTPWNFPLAMGARKIAPALAAGCTTVCKPAAETPLTMLYLARLAEEVGVPAGAINVVPTTRPREVVGAMLDDGRARKLSFTGSTAVGQELQARAARHVLRTSLELGGNAPLIVCEDADVETAVAGAVVAKMRNIGQSCVAANRILVHAAVLDRFRELFVDAMRELRLGHGLDETTDVGPLIHHQAADDVHAAVRAAADDGATVLLGGEPASSAGSFYPPTVLADVPAHAPLLRSEIFGPVAPIVRVESDDEAIALANDTDHGLAAYVFTRDLQRGLAYIESLETGMVGLNRGLVSEPAAPFGGVKHSGLGREGGTEGLEEYLELTYAAVDMP